MTPEFTAHPFCTNDFFSKSDIALTDIDYEANNWKF